MANYGPHLQHVPDANSDDSPQPRKPTVNVLLPYHPRQLEISRQEFDSPSISRPSSISGTDEDSEDYDWSGEDDLVDEEVKFVNKTSSNNKRCGPKRVFALLFSSLLGSTFFAIILVLPALLVHFYWYKPHPTEHRHYVSQNVKAWLFWTAANIVISWWLAMFVDIIPIIIQYFLSITWGHISESLKTKIEMYDSVKDTPKPAFYAGSGFASWVIIFGHIFNLYSLEDETDSRAGYTIRLYQVVQFFFFLIIIRCVQRMLSHMIAWNFHRTAYKERIESLRKTLSVIQKLRDHRPKISKQSTPKNKSGTRTPIFGNINFGSTFSDTEHFNFLTGALRTATPRFNTSPFHSPAGTDEGHEGGSMDEGKALVTKDGNRTGSKKHPWFAHSSSKSKDGIPQEDPTLQGFFGHGKKNNAESDTEMEDVPLHNMLDSLSVTPTRFNPHRYPPTSQPGSPRQSLDAGHSINSAGNSEGDFILVHAAKLLKSAVMHDARNIKGNNETSTALAWNVNSTSEAKRLARSIYMRLKDRYRTYLIPADFYPAFPTHEAAEAAFHVFDKDSNGDLSRAEIKTALVKAYKERRFLSRSMKDTGAALKSLDRILLFFAGVILFFISLSVFGVEVGSSLSSVYSIGIAASFIFKSSASNAFDAIMFLFVSHPYDTGDRVFVDLENLVVKKVGLFATVFVRSDGTETYYFNSQLFGKFITNARRSGKTFENLTMQVAWRTSLTKLDALEKCLNDWLSTEENRWFEPTTSITLQHIVYQRYLELTIGIGHNGNWQDWGLRNSRKTAFHSAVQYYCRQLGIVGCEAPIPVVYADPTTRRYDLLSLQQEHEDHLPAGTSPPPPPSPRTEQEWKEEEEEAERAAREMKPTLGFLPPLAVRSSSLAKARKSNRSKKTNLGAMNG